MMRGVDGAAVPVLRYRTQVDAFGPEIADAYGSRHEAACSEGTEWIWSARPEGAVLLGAPTVEWRAAAERQGRGVCPRGPGSNLPPPFRGTLSTTAKFPRE
jgi:hypothetical protein